MTAPCMGPGVFERKALQMCFKRTLDKPLKGVFFKSPWPHLWCCPYFPHATNLERRLPSTKGKLGTSSHIGTTQNFFDAAQTYCKHNYHYYIFASGLTTCTLTIVPCGCKRGIHMCAKIRKQHEQPAFAKPEQLEQSM